MKANSSQLQTAQLFNDLAHIAVDEILSALRNNCQTELDLSGRPIIVVVLPEISGQSDQKNRYLDAIEQLLKSRIDDESDWHWPAVNIGVLLSSEKELDEIESASRVMQFSGSSVA